MATKRTARTTANLRLETYPLEQAVPACVTPYGPTLVSRDDAEADGVPSASGCLRGLCWGLAVEAAGGLLLYGAWHLAVILR
jgi:hypothetical protein